MTNLTAYKSEAGVELYIDNTNGAAFVSQSGYVRMSGVAKSTVSDRMNKLRFQVLKTTEHLTATGLRSVKLIPASIIFQWAFKDNPALAYAMGEAGATIYLQKLAGYKVTSTAVVEDELPGTAVVEHKLPGNYRDALMALVESIDKEAAALEGKQLAEAEVKILAPKAKVADDFISNDGLTTIEQFSKDLAIKDLGRNRLYILLRELSILGQNNQPYQQFVAKGLFVVKPSGSYKDNYGETVQTYKTFLTASGVEWLIAKLSRMGIN